MQQPRRGFNLLETAIVLGVVGMVIGGIWVAHDYISSNRKASQAISDILITSQNIQNLMGRSVFTTANQTIVLTPTILRNLKTIPDSMIIAGSNLEHAWGGTMRVEVSNIVATSCADNAGNERIRIFYNNLSEASCRQMVARLSVASRGSSGACAILIGEVPNSTGSQRKRWNSPEFPISPDAPECSGGAPTLLVLFPLIRN